MKSYIKSSTAYKRIARTDEFDNGHVLHGDWMKMSDEEAEELAKQASIENPGKIYYVKYDDLMNGASDIKWVNGKSYDTYKDALDASRGHTEKYIKSDSGFGEDFDVFMLMDYSADTGPDTIGMEGDSFDCIGKFFATDLQSAKAELSSILSAHPELNEVCPGLYVDVYNPYFDSPTREEQDEYGNPYSVDNNVFDSLTTLVEKRFDWDYLNNYAKGMEEDDELPFPISMEDTFSPEDDNFALYAISNTIDSISLDPDYSETIEDIRWASDPDSGVYTIKLYFWDGGYNLIEIDPAELESQADYNQASKLVQDRINSAINEYTGG